MAEVHTQRLHLLHPRYPQRLDGPLFFVSMMGKDKEYWNLLVRLVLAGSSAFLAAGFGGAPPFGAKKDRMSEGIFGDDYLASILTIWGQRPSLIPCASVAWWKWLSDNLRQSRSSLEVRVW